MVARLRLQGLTQREVVASLPQLGVFDPISGEPYKLTTVNADCKALDQEWEASAREDTAKHKGRILAKVLEAQRLAMASTPRDLRSFLAAIKQEAELVGANAPIAFDIAAIDKAIEHDLAVAAAIGAGALQGATAAAAGRSGEGEQ